MFVFSVGRIEVVCAVIAAAVGAISPSPRVRLDAFCRAVDRRRLCVEDYAISDSLNGVFVRHIACSVTASFRKTENA